MSHIPNGCPAVRETGQHNFSAWTTEMRTGVPLLWRHCFECPREEWEFEQPEEKAA